MSSPRPPLVATATARGGGGPSSLTLHQSAGYRTLGVREQDRWRHPVRYVRTRSDLRPEDVNRPTVS
jgi:hypothetical protein